ncbi:MAG: hypothetical protein ABIK09_20330 [Pseudomonadota bacterium]
MDQVPQDAAGAVETTPQDSDVGSQPEVADASETDSSPDTGEALWSMVGPWERRRHFDAVLAFGEDDVWLIGWDRPILRWDGEALVEAWTDEVPIYPGGIWGTDSSNVWVAGGIWDGDGVGELLIHWDGTAWTNHETGFEVPLNGIWGTDDGRLWAMGPQATVLFFDGSAWTQAAVESDPSIAEHTVLRSIWGSSAEDIWVVGSRGQEFHGAVAYHWNGAAWTKPPILPADGTLGGFYSVWGSGPDDVWIGAWNDLGYSPYDEPETPMVRWDGSQWSVVDPGPGGVYWWVSGSAADDVWVAGAGDVHHWDGAAWAETAVTGGGGAVASLGPALAWTATGGGALHRWDGATWSQVVWPVPHLEAVSGTAERIWVAGTDGVVASWGGEGWELEHPEAMTDFHDLWIGPDGQPWVVGDDGAVLRRTPDGWQPLEPPTEMNLYGIWGSSIEDVWVVGGSAASASNTGDPSEGVVIQWDGVAWEAHDVPADGNRLAVAGNGPDDVWVVGFDLAPFHWDGTEWTAHPLPVESMPFGSMLYDLSLDPVGRVWVRGTRRLPDIETEILFTAWYEDGGWSVEDTGDGYTYTIAASWEDGTWTFGTDVHANLWIADAELVDLEIEGVGEPSPGHLFGRASGDLWAVGRRGQVFSRQEPSGGTR